MVLEKLSALIAEQFGVDASEITEETSFVGDLVEVIMSVEEAFDLGEVEDGTLENVKTVGDVVQFITSRVGE